MKQGLKETQGKWLRCVAVEGKGLVLARIVRSWPEDIATLGRNSWVLARIVKSIQLWNSHVWQDTTKPGLGQILSGLGRNNRVGQRARIAGSSEAGNSGGGGDAEKADDDGDGCGAGGGSRVESGDRAC
uniref:Uncharacterized protein n=1 Tax=Tanacetum cinerariifolium TaxID=118510 RepID=A0A699L7R5_TANCI|nr:hypothetical protein [Tanacetum cinerariifolium]